MQNNMNQENMHTAAESTAAGAGVLQPINTNVPNVVTTQQATEQNSAAAEECKAEKQPTTGAVETKINRTPKQENAEGEPVLG